MTANLSNVLAIAVGFVSGAIVGSFNQRDNVQYASFPGSPNGTRIAVIPKHKTDIPQAIVSATHKIKLATRPLDLSQLGILYKEWASENPQEALASWESLDIPWSIGSMSPKEEILTTILDGWATNDPISAAKWLRGNAALGCALSESFVNSLCRLDPKLGIEAANQCYLNSSSPSISRTRLAQAFTNYYANNKNEATEFLSEKLRNRPDDVLIRDVVNSLSKSSSPEDVHQFSAELYSLSSPIAGRALLSVMSRTDPLKALSLALGSDSLPSEALLDQLREANSTEHNGYTPPLAATISQAWANAIRRDGEAAAAFAANLSDSDARSYLESRIPENLVDNPESAVLSFEQLNQESLEQAARLLISALRKRQGNDAAKQWGDRINSPLAKEVYMKALSE